MTAPTGKPKGRPRKADVVHLDSAYANAFLGIGTSKDRSIFTVGLGSRILQQGELEALYRSDGMVRRIIDLPAEEMLRAGYSIEGVEDSSKVTAALDGIDANNKVTDALRWSRLYGGSLIVMLINDRNNLTTPLNEESAKEIEQLRVYDRWQVTIQTWYEDPNDKRFGKPKEYLISPIKGTPYTVHESRCLVFDGTVVPDRVREENEGWGGSVIQHCYDQLVRLNMSYVWGNALLERAQTPIHGIPELSNLLRSPGGEDMVRKRVDMVDMARSINNTVVIDAAETYELKSTSFANVPDIMDRMGIALSAVTGMPESLLFGVRQKGLGTSGQGDLENWYAKVEQMQEVEVLPQLDKLVGLQLRAMGLWTEDYEIDFAPLYVPSSKDKAETDYKTAQTFEIYVNMGAMDPSEVRLMLPDEGFELDNPEELPPPDPVELERAQLELEGMAKQNEQDPNPRESAEVDLLKAKAEALRKAPKADEALLGRIDNILGDLDV